jgi:hypothetical protein
MMLPFSQCFAVGIARHDASYSAGEVSFASQIDLLSNRDRLGSPETPKHDIGGERTDGKDGDGRIWRMRLRVHKAYEVRFSACFSSEIINI